MEEVRNLLDVLVNILVLREVPEWLFERNLGEYIEGEELREICQVHWFVTVCFLANEFDEVADTIVDFRFEFWYLFARILSECKQEHRWELCNPLLEPSLLGECCEPRRLSATGSFYAACPGSYYRTRFLFGTWNGVHSCGARDPGRW